MARSTRNGGPYREGGLRKRPIGRRAGFVARMRGYLLAGTLVTAPIALTVYLAWLFIAFVDSRVTPLIPARYNPETYLPFGIPGLGVLVVVVFLILVGWLTAGFAGRFLLKWGEDLVARLPVLRSVYTAIKQILETVLAQQSTAFRQVVLVEYPRRGIWAIGFVSGETEGEVQNVTKDKLINVFLPTTPNPTSGFLLFVPRQDLHVLDMTIEEGAKMVISGGLVTPPDRRGAGTGQGFVTAGQPVSQPAAPLPPPKAAPKTTPRRRKSTSQRSKADS